MNRVNNIHHLIPQLLLVFFLFSCNNVSTSGSKSPETKKLISITNPASIILDLTDRTDGDSVVSFLAKGLYQQDTVGFLLEVNKNIPAGINNDGSVNEKDGFKKGVITFRKSGTESDLFVSALAKLWQIPGIDKMKATPIQPLAFFSNKNPINLDKVSTSSFKLFFDDQSANPGEVFFTIDTYKKTIEFQEKDAQNRPAIARTFAE